MVLTVCLMGGQDVFAQIFNISGTVVNSTSAIKTNCTTYLTLYNTACSAWKKAENTYLTNVAAGIATAAATAATTKYAKLSCTIPNNVPTGKTISTQISPTNSYTPYNNANYGQFGIPSGSGTPYTASVALLQGPITCKSGDGKTTLALTCNQPNAAGVPTYIQGYSCPCPASTDATDPGAACVAKAIPAAASAAIVAATAKANYQPTMGTVTPYVDPKIAYTAPTTGLTCTNNVPLACTCTAASCTSCSTVKAPNMMGNLVVSPGSSGCN